MKKFTSCFLLVLLCFNFCKFAVCHAAQNSHKVNVKSGTSVSIIIPTYKTSKNTMVGEQIPAEIYRDVFVDNVKVFRQGDIAFLNVTAVKKAGCLGQAGKIQVINGTANDANGDSRKVRLYYTVSGEEKAYPKILLGVSLFLLWPLALTGFVKGEEAQFSQMAPLDIFVDEDFTFTGI